MHWKTLLARSEGKSRARPWVGVLFFLGCGPFLLFPGGELEGSVAPVPNEWGLVEEISTVELESRPQDPYSVNIWATGIGESLYVHAGTNRSSWVENIEADPRVRVGIEGNLYPLRAVRVQDAGEFARFADAYEVKYGRRPRNEVVEEVYLYRLEAR